MGFCLPSELVQPFLKAIDDGQLDLSNLSDRSIESSDRRAAFAKIVGEENAKELNSLFESKLILKNQKAGLERFIASAGNLVKDADGNLIPKTPTDRNLIAKISKLDTLLTPGEEEKFLVDATATKLGTEVTAEEAKNITKMSQKAAEAQNILKQDPLNTNKQIAYGRSYIDMIDYVDSLKPQPRLWTVTNVLNLPKSALTSVLHFSAPFVQGRAMLATRPWWEAFGNQFKYYASTKAYKDFNASIVGHPDYQFAVNGKLGLTKLGDKLSNREEALQSSLLDHVPGLKIPVLASSRAFTGFLNEVRFKNFVNLLNAARLRGEDVSLNSQGVKDIAQTVNNFTGRGSLGKNDRFAQLGPTLNMGLFSPRKMVATFQQFNPLKYADPRISTTAKLGAMRYMVGTVITTGAILELAHLGGAGVNINPTSTDFLKIKLGKTTIDTTGGSASYLRFLARIIENRTTNAKGKTTVFGSRYGAPTAPEEAVSYLRGKLAPTAALLTDAFLFHSDAIGRPLNLVGEKGGFVNSEAYNKLFPIVSQQFIDLALSDPKNVGIWLLALSAIFGVDVQTPTPTKK